MTGFLLTYYTDHEHPGPFLKYTGTVGKLNPSLVADLLQIDDGFEIDGTTPYIVEIDVANGMVYGLPVFEEGGGENYLEGPFELASEEALELIERCSP